MFEYNQRMWIKYTNELYLSPAYQSLSKSARNLFHCFMNELRFTKGKYKKPSTYTNNGDVSFTVVQFRKIFGVTSQTYFDARDKLIEVGLLKQTYRGGMCRGDMAKYKVLALTHLPKVEERWRDYPNRNWKSEIPKSKGSTVGKETRWKKGQSGRKTKATLQKYTLNGTIHPIKVDP